MKEELRPRLRLAITMPSKACTRFLSPSTTLTFTMTVSPGAKSGISRFSRLISSCSIVWIRFMVVLRSALVFTDGSLLSFVLLPEFFQQVLFFLAQLLRRQQVRPSEPGPAERLLQPPAPDVLVVSRHQHLRHLHPAAFRAPHLGARVLRAVEQPVG